jgi:hypothetical protein
MNELQMRQERLAKAIAERMQVLLADNQVKGIYNSFSAEAAAQDWLMKTALITLVVPISERQAQ